MIFGFVKFFIVKCLQGLGLAYQVGAILMVYSKIEVKLIKLIFFFILNLGLGALGKIYRLRKNIK